MRSILLLVISFFHFSAQAVEDTGYPGPYHLDHLDVPADGADLVPFAEEDLIQVSNLRLESWLNSGRSYATRAFRLSYRNSRNYPSFRKFVDAAQKSFAKAQVVTPPSGKDFKACTAYTLAFVIMGQPKIYICKRMLTQSYWGVSKLGQTLVHEGLHVHGVGNECETTEIEVSVMNTSGLGVQYKNGYWGPCGIKEIEKRWL